MSDVAAAWNVYADTKQPRRAVNAAGSTTWFNWTQYPDHGPGAELLDPQPGATIADLGCGKGGNAAHLAVLGCRVTAVDVAAKQLDAARARWGDDVRWVQADALDCLADSPPLHAVASVFGALYFADPATSLPAVHAALKPGGRLVFSQRPPVDGCYGCQATMIRRPDSTAAMVRRWDYTPDMWRDILTSHGFVAVDARVLAAPDGSDEEGTLLVQARAQALAVK